MKQCMDEFPTLEFKEDYNSVFSPEDIKTKQDEFVEESLYMIKAFLQRNGKPINTINFIASSLNLTIYCHNLFSITDTIVAKVSYNEGFSYMIYLYGKKIFIIRSKMEFEDFLPTENSNTNSMAVIKAFREIMCKSRSFYKEEMLEDKNLSVSVHYKSSLESHYTMQNIFPQTRRFIPMSISLKVECGNYIKSYMSDMVKIMRMTKELKSLSIFYKEKTLFDIRCVDESDGCILILRCKNTLYSIVIGYNKKLKISFGCVPLEEMTYYYVENREVTLEILEDICEIISEINNDVIYNTSLEREYSHSEGYMKITFKSGLDNLTYDTKKRNLANYF